MGYDKLECGLCWVGFGWSLEESESKNSVFVIINYIKIRSLLLYIRENIYILILIFYDFVLFVILFLI